MNNDIIRVVVCNSLTDQNTVACLKRPLVWEEVVQELYSAIANSEYVLSHDEISSYKILLHPTKCKSDKGVTIRRNILDLSIRDGDLLSLLKLEEHGKIILASTCNPTTTTTTTTTSSSENNPIRHVGSETISLQLEKIDNKTSLSKSKRGRSLSSRFWLANKLASSGAITKEQKDRIKALLISGDEQEIDRAFHQFEQTGDIDVFMNVSDKTIISLRSRKMNTVSNKRILDHDDTSGEFDLVGLPTNIDMSFLNMEDTGDTIDQTQPTSPLLHLQTSPLQTLHTSHLPTSQLPLQTSPLQTLSTSQLQLQGGMTNWPQRFNDTRIQPIDLVELPQTWGDEEVDSIRHLLATETTNQQLAQDLFGDHDPNGVDWF